MNINFSSGAYDSYGINPFKTMIMESSLKTKNVIKDFEKAVSSGIDPVLALNKVMSERHYSKSDFTDSDIELINLKVESCYS